LGKQQNTALLWTGENKVCRAAIYYRRDGRDFPQNHAQHLHVDGRGSVALCKNRKYDQNQSFGSRSDLETVHGSEREKVSRAGPPGRETSAVSVRARFKTSKINSQRVYPTAGFLATDNLDLVQKCLAGRDPASELSSDPRIEPESGKPETINGANIYDVEFETGGRRSVNASRLRPIDLTRGLSQSPLLNRLFGSDASEIRW
jgi:hypothetical protein